MHFSGDFIYHAHTHLSARLPHLLSHRARLASARGTHALTLLRLPHRHTIPHVLSVTTRTRLHLFAAISVRRAVVPASASLPRAHASFSAPLHLEFLLPLRTVFRCLPAFCTEVVHPALPRIAAALPLPPAPRSLLRAAAAFACRAPGTAPLLPTTARMRKLPAVNPVISAVTWNDAVC